MQKENCPQGEKEIGKPIFLLSMDIVAFQYNQDVDDIFANAYLLIDENKSAVLVDPSCDYDGIINYIKKNNISLKGVLLTHNHFDHIKGLNRTIKEFNVPFYIHANDEGGLYEPRINCSNYFKEQIIIEYKPILIEDNEIISLLKEDIKVIFTPFHTKGSVCYYVPTSKMLISGDTLFKLAVGRSDLVNAAPKEKANTFAKIMSLPFDTKVYPGHGKSTDIETERLKNPFIYR